MQEFVGYCASCNKKIYCLDGFIHAVVLEDKTLLCFDCSSDENKDKN